MDESQKFSPRSSTNTLATRVGAHNWTNLQLRSFVYHTIRGFLYSDLYNAVTEFLSRAKGSFGLQVHCTVEPGVVVIASKGQPMSISFSPAHPMVLFASEAEALAVPVFKSGKWMPVRLDLDTAGEISRIGPPRALHEGNFIRGLSAEAQHQLPVASLTMSNLSNHNTSTTHMVDVFRPMEYYRGRDRGNSVMKASPSFGHLPITPRQNIFPTSHAPSHKKVGLLLASGVEILMYSLTSCSELSEHTLTGRTVKITSAPLPYDPKADLVAGDLAVTPGVMAAIDSGELSNTYLVSVC